MKTKLERLFVDQLANEIRRVDGSHSLGAGALAEALMPFISALQFDSVLSRQLVPVVQATAPQRIYLAVSDEEFDREQPFNEYSSGEVCWSTDEPVAVCVPYVRADLASLAPPGDSDLAGIGELIRTQDNRITDQPIFIVQQRSRIYGLDDGHAEGHVWHYDGAESSYDDAAKAERDAERADDGSPPLEWDQVGYIDIWEFVTACFTEQGCKDYIAINGHNLREPRIYAEGSFRNNEWRQVRNFLIGASPAQPNDADKARLDWLEANEASLITHQESFGVDDPESEYSIWWNVVKDGKSISGHPLGYARDAIDFAMAAAAPSVSHGLVG